MSLSSLNRHAVATRADVGRPKATVLAEHLLSIVPEARVDGVVAMYTSEASEQLLGGSRKPDFLIDAIDNVDTKVRPCRSTSASFHPKYQVAHPEFYLSTCSKIYFVRSEYPTNISFNLKTDALLDTCLIAERYGVTS